MVLKGLCLSKWQKMLKLRDLPSGENDLEKAEGMTLQSFAETWES